MRGKRGVLQVTFQGSESRTPFSTLFLWWGRSEMASRP